jgi:hypothetical protein
MLQAYVGIVSQRGIEVFCPEHPDTMRFLARRARRQRGRTACFWSVLPDDAVSRVRTTLRLGQPRSAFEILQVSARDIGLIPLDDTEHSGRTGDQSRI